MNTICFDLSLRVTRVKLPSHGWLFVLLALLGWAGLPAVLAERAPTPRIFPISGTLVNPGLITMSTTTAGAQLWYTTNGSEPTQGAPSILYTGPFQLAGLGAKTVKLKSFAPDYEPSLTKIGNYTLVNPPPGGYVEVPKNVYQMTATANVFIDANMSTMAQLGGNPAFLRVDLGFERSIGKIAYTPGYQDFYFAKYRVYVTSNPSVSHPTDWGAPVLESEWSSEDAGIAEFPTTTGRFVIFEAVSAKRRNPDTSAALSIVAISEFSVFVAAPDAMPAAQRPIATQPSGTYSLPFQLQLSTVTAGAEIWYTTDGTDPVQGAPSQLYSGGVMLTSAGAVTLKATAFHPAHRPSLVMNIPYTIVEPAPGEYLALNKRQMTADASFFSHPAYHPSQTIDGQLGTHWLSYQNAGHGEWVRLDFGAGIERTIGKILFQKSPLYWVGLSWNYSIYITSDPSTDPGAWGSPAANLFFDELDDPIEFTPRTGRFIILQCEPVVGPLAGLAEVTIYETQSSSFPPATSPQLSLPDGAYLSPVAMRIESDVLDAETWYTLDGSEPVQGSPSMVYTERFIIEGEGTVDVKAKTFAPGFSPSLTSASSLELLIPPLGTMAQINPHQFTRMPTLPYSGNGFVFDFGGGIALNPGRLVYSPLFDAQGNRIAAVISYRIALSDDGVNWDPPIVEGQWTWAAGETQKVVDWPPQSSRFIRFLPVGWELPGNNPTASVIDLFAAATGVSTPLISPASGPHEPPITVSMTMRTPGAEIYYTLDGTEPVDGAPSTLYTSPFELGSVGIVTVKARGFAADMEPSAINSATYALPPVNAAAPQFSAAGGYQVSPLAVTITSATSGADIWYTTNGAEPVQGAPSLRYTGPVTVTGSGGSSVTLKAKAFSPLYHPSATTTATYSMHLPGTATPTISPGDGTYQRPLTVTMACPTPGAEIWYSIGTVFPRQGPPSIKYTGPFTITTTGRTPIRAQAFAPNMEPSAVRLRIYTIVP